MKNLLVILSVFLTLWATAQTKEESDMIKWVNQVRSCPSSIIPKVEEFIKDKGKDSATRFEGIKLIGYLNSHLPVKGLTVSSDLNKIAQSHANYLISVGQFGHNGPNGQTPKDRLKSIGLSGGENCVDVDPSRDAMYVLIYLLIDNTYVGKEHRANIFNTEYTKIGVGKVGRVWVLDFAY